MSDVHGLLSGATHLSWQSFETRVARATSGFAQLGVGEGAAVVLLMRNDPAFLEANLAAVRRGAYAVPINWHATADEIAYILKDSGAGVLVAHADLWRRAGDAIPPATTVLLAPPPPEVAAAYGLAEAELDVPPGTLPWHDWVEAQVPSREAQPAPCESMIYTSGTTGRPKGVRRFRPTGDQLAGLRELRARVYGIAPGMRALVPGPLYHSAPNAYALNAVSMGGLVVLMPRFDAEAFLALVERHHITHSFMVPTMFARLLKLPEHMRRRYDVSSLECVVHAAAPCPDHVKAAMIAWWGGVLVEFYGATEIGPVTLCGSAEWLARRGTVGRAVESAEIKVLDDDGRELPAGTAGELFVRVHAYPDFTYRNQPEERRRIEFERPRQRGRRRLPRQRGLSLSLRPQARHDHLGRGQHLPRRDRGRPPGPPRGRRLCGLRHPRRGVRRERHGRGRPRPWGCPPARRAARGPRRACRRLQAAAPDRDPERTSARGFRQDPESAHCAIPIGRRRGGRFEGAASREKARNPSPACGRGKGPIPKGWEG